MLNIMPFITQPQDFHTAEAAKALAGNRNAYMEHEDRQAALAENKRQFNEVQPRQNFKAFGDQYNSNREAEQKQQESDTKLMQWIQSVVETDPEKAERSAPFLHGILQVHGINMNFEPSGQASAPPVAEATGAATAQISPQSVGARAAAQAPAPPAPVETTAPEPPPPQNEDEGLQQLEEAQRLSAIRDAADAEEERIQRQVEEGVPAPLPGESPAVYGARARGVAQAKPEPAKPVPAPKAPPPPAASVAVPPPAAPAPAVPVAAPPQGPKGRWVFSKGGKELGAIDIGGLRDLGERRARGAAEGFAAGVLPKVDQSFVQQAIQKGLESGAIYDADSAQAYIKQIIAPELHRRSYERAAGMAAQAATARAQAGGVGQTRLSWTAGNEAAIKLGDKMDMPTVLSTLRTMPELKGKIASGNYGAVMGAIYNIARANDPKGIVTDHDFANAQTRTLWDKLKDFFSVNDPTADPNLNEDEIRRLGELAGIMEKGLVRRKHQIMDAVPKLIKTMPDAEMVQGAKGYFNPQFGDDPEWDPDKMQGRSTQGPGGRGGPGGGAVGGRTIQKGSPRVQSELAGEEPSVGDLKKKGVR